MCQLHCQYFFLIFFRLEAVCPLPLPCTLILSCYALIVNTFFKSIL
nr:MAG TPA: hypothetical protein [Herelleviridae sp.]